jgi:hypothetical protein
MTHPLWIVWNPDGGDTGPDDGKRFRAFSAQNAVEEWAHRFENYDGEYTLEENPETVMVCPVDDTGNQRKFRVRARTSRDYFADELPLT